MKYLTGGVVNTFVKGKTLAMLERASAFVNGERDLLYRARHFPTHSGTNELVGRKNGGCPGGDANHCVQSVVEKLGTPLRQTVSDEGFLFD